MLNLLLIDIRLVRFYLAIGLKCLFYGKSHRPPCHLRRLIQKPMGGQIVLTAKMSKFI